MSELRALIEQAVARRESFAAGESGSLLPRTLPAELLPDGVPTLAPQRYRPVTPMLQERFALFGRWTRATHGDWLSPSDMEALWQPDIAESYHRALKAACQTNAEHWPNDAAGLFLPERLTLFAASELTYERVYLLWLDFEDEPEVWAYDANGESRYRSLETYLRAYLTDDVSAAEHRWRAVD